MKLTFEHIIDYTTEKFYESFGLLKNKLGSWISEIILMLPNILVAALVVVCFYLASKYLSNLILSLLRRFSKNTAINKLIATLCSLLINLIGLFVALGILNLDKTVTSLLAGVGVVGLALGFAFQNSAANFISGLGMAIRSPLNVGDLIETNDYYGMVSKIGLRSTEIRTLQGQLVDIPNRLIYQNPFANYNTLGSRRIDLVCGVSYGDDLQKVEDLVLKAIEGISNLDKQKKPALFFSEFGDSSINFKLLYWVKFKEEKDYLKAVHEGIKIIKSAFDENDITIPFPIRTLDFGIKGGEKISEQTLRFSHSQTNGSQ